MKLATWMTNARVVYTAAFLIRLLLIVIGEWQDKSLSIPYTDVDYEVISDAAALVAAGRSPYDRATYRYSPLLSFLLVPNLIIHRCWGKVVFSLADLVVGKLLQCILQKRSLTSASSLQYACLWLLNPLSINVSTRGSFDAITSALILGTVFALLQGSFGWAAIVFGVVVHLRVYPIIYAPAFALFVARQLCSTAATERTSDNDLSTSPKPVVWEDILSVQPVKFVVLSAGSFSVCTAACAWAYGLRFVRCALLYHLTRTDNRHSYSIYWYWIYLDYGTVHRSIVGLMAFLPQVLILLVCAVSLHGDLPLCIFVQTAVFVFFNKVFTGQYMTWFLCLAPLLAGRLKLQRSWSAVIVGAWMVSLLSWLFFAWNLEMRGRNVFVALWAASVLMFGTNLVTLNACLRGCTLRIGRE